MFTMFKENIIRNKLKINISYRINNLTNMEKGIYSPHYKPVTIYIEDIKTLKECYLYYPSYNIIKSDFKTVETNKIIKSVKKYKRKWRKICRQNSKKKMAKPSLPLLQMLQKINFLLMNKNTSTVFFHNKDEQFFHVYVCKNEEYENRTKFFIKSDGSVEIDFNKNNSGFSLKELHLISQRQSSVKTKTKRRQSWRK